MRKLIFIAVAAFMAAIAVAAQAAYSGEWTGGTTDESGHQAGTIRIVVSNGVVKKNASQIQWTAPCRSVYQSISSYTTFYGSLTSGSKFKLNNARYTAGVLTTPYKAKHVVDVDFTIRGPSVVGTFRDDVQIVQISHGQVVRVVTSCSTGFLRFVAFVSRSGMIVLERAEAIAETYIKKRCGVKLVYRCWSTNPPDCSETEDYRKGHSHWLCDADILERRYDTDILKLLPVWRGCNVALGLDPYGKLTEIEKHCEPVTPSAVYGKPRAVPKAGSASGGSAVIR